MTGNEDGARTYPHIADEMPRLRVELNAKRKLIKMLYGDLVFVGDWIRKYEAAVGVEEIPAGQTYTYTPAFDEVQLVLRGKGSMTYLMPASKYTVRKTMELEAGDAYVMVKGSNITWEADASGPLTRFCVVMPALLDYDPRFLAPGSVIELQNHQAKEG